MKLFTVGPVEMHDSTLKIASHQVPYFRTQDFSDIMLKCQENFLSLLNAPIGSSMVVLTCSGSGAMETAVMNGLKSDDKVIVVNGGTFGNRFSQLCTFHNIEHEDINLAFGKTLTSKHLEIFENQKFTALLINAHETSTGQLYDLKMLGDFCKRNNMRFIVDAVSSFLVDHIDMQEMNIDMIFTASQKALALSPGLAFVVTTPQMTEFVKSHECACSYLDMKDYYINMERGQTPYTPAVSIVYELQDRLNSLVKKGIDVVNAEHADRAGYFRNECKKIGLQYGQYPLSNGLTPLIFNNDKAYEYFIDAKDNHDLMLTPNGGELSKSVLRIGHMGNLTYDDYDKVIEYFKEKV